MSSQPLLTPSGGGPFAPLSSSSSLQQPMGMSMGAPLISTHPMSSVNSTSPFSSLSSAQNQSLGGHSPVVVPPPSQQQASPGMVVQSSPGAAMGMRGMGTASGGGVGMGSNVGVGIGVGASGNNVFGMGPGLAQQPAADPLAVLDEAFVPMDAIKPGKGFCLKNIYILCVNGRVILA